MKNYQKSFVTILGSLVVVIVGLFLVCSQRLSIQEDEFGEADLSDGEFRQELMDMLDLSDNSTEMESFNEIEDSEVNDADVLALLGVEATDSEPVFSPVESGAESEGVPQEKFSKMRSEVDRLDGLLWRQSSTADSLQRIIDKRNARISELEKLITDAGQQERTTPVPQTQSVSRASTNYGSLQTGMGTEYMNNYRHARELFEARNYRDAIGTFEALLSENPDHPMADNCQYWIGESFFGLKQYSKAALEFQKVFAYNQKDKYDDAQLMIGLSYFRNGEREKARYEFEVFVSNYSGSEYTAIAERYIERI